MFIILYYKTNHNHVELSNDGTKIPARLIIHDRNRVQSEVLPSYYNHASFASFRRNLSYFSFVRLGRGRHTGAVTYIHDAVFNLTDILHLKRRAVGSPPGGSTTISTRQPAPSSNDATQQSPKKKSPHSGVKRSRDQPIMQEELTKDVTSTVISGKMHASKTNHSLDDNKKSKFQTTTVNSSRSISDITLRTKSRGEFTSSKKKTCSSDYKSKKGGRRVHRFLHANGIVPFIHLPMRVSRNNNSSSDSVASALLALRSGLST